MTTFKVGDRVRHKYAPATCVGVVVDARDLDTKVLVDRSDYAVPQPDERWIPNYNLEHEPRPVAHEDSPVLVENIALTLGLDRWPVLVPFIAAMVRKLDANKPKKGGREGWQHDDPIDLLERVREETAELSRAVVAQPDTTETRADARAAVLYEAADVANMAMMVADAKGALDVPHVRSPVLVDEVESAKTLIDRASRAAVEAYRAKVLEAFRAWNERPSDTRTWHQVVIGVELP